MRRQHPAEKAGLRSADTNRCKLGDVIVAANGKPVHRIPDLTTELDQIGVSSEVRLTVDRNGQQVEVADIADR